MDGRDRRKELDAVTERIIGCAYNVINTLGHGFLEKVYENALAHELRECGLRVQQQHPITVRYRASSWESCLPIWLWKKASLSS